MSTPTEARPASGHHDHGPGTAPGPGRLRATLRAVNATPMSRARAGILVGLVALTAASWVFLFDRSGDMDAHEAMTPTMGMGAPLFLAVWIAMMAATMFPAVAPMVLMYARIAANKRTQGQAFVPTWLFVTGYLLLWTALGAVAFVLALGAENLAAEVGLGRPQRAPGSAAGSSSSRGRSSSASSRTAA